VIAIDRLSIGSARMLRTVSAPLCVSMPSVVTPSSPTTNRNLPDGSTVTKFTPVPTVNGVPPSAGVRMPVDLSNRYLSTPALGPDEALAT
jgi:hypothetical protein